MPRFAATVIDFLASLVYFAPLILVDFALYAGLFLAVRNGLDGKPFGVANLFAAFGSRYKKTVLLGLFVFGSLLALLVTVFGLLGGLEFFMLRAAQSDFVPLFGNLIPLYYVVAFAALFGASVFVTYPYLLLWEEGKSVKETLLDSFRLGKRYFKPTLLYLLSFVGIAAIVGVAVAIVMGLFLGLQMLFLPTVRSGAPVLVIAGGGVVGLGLLFALPILGSWSYATCAALYRKIMELEAR